MNQVIVGFDAHEESDDALVLGEALANVIDAELHVATVLPRGAMPFEAAIAGGSVSEQLDRSLYESAERRLGHGDFIRASLEGELGGRSAAHALYEYAAEQRADLIVVGSSHRGKVGRILPGSVGESLLRGAPCAVTVAPRGYARREHPGFGLIGVAYDGSEEAGLALEEAERLSRSLDAELRVITVNPVVTKTLLPVLARFELDAEGMESLFADQRRFYRGALDTAMAKLGDESTVEAIFEEGDPAVVLAEQGIELDLLVMGSRGYGPVRSALLGAISSAVMRTAPCPVLITPRGLEHADRPAERAERELAADS
jgi:nucleotide-binding universal stress UspA family protein